MASVSLYGSALLWRDTLLLLCAIVWGKLTLTSGTKSAFLEIILSHKLGIRGLPADESLLLREKLAQICLL